MAQKSQQLPAKRNRGKGRPFVKGQVANPGGRPKEIGDVRALARKHTPMAIKTLAEIAENGSKEASRVAAADSLLDRAWGRPSQPIEGGETLGAAIIAALEAAKQRTRG